ncbi:MAG: thiol:disulfide interchange protein [Proteobacteria bacterium]|nr:thiol:disulfide interchange protein [Pseudomonadota bacterium]
MEAHTMRALNLLALLVLILITSCTSRDSLKTLLENDPDILIEAMEKNADKFAPAFQRINAKGRQAMERLSREQEAAQREEEFKNPTKIEIESTRAISGKEAAPITIVVFSDFECPFCKRGADTLTEVKQKYGDQVKFIFKHYPLPFHPLAMPAAEYFEAIALQSSKKAYLFHDELFKNQEAFKTEKEKFLDRTARKLGVDMARLKADLKSDKVKANIKNDMEEGQKLGVRGTPKFYINGVSLNGARPFSDFELIIERLRKS